MEESVTLMSALWQGGKAHHRQQPLFIYLYKKKRTVSKNIYRNNFKIQFSLFVRLGNIYQQYYQNLHTIQGYHFIISFLFYRKKEMVLEIRIDEILIKLARGRRKLILLQFPFNAP